MKMKTGLLFLVAYGLLTSLTYGQDNFKHCTAAFLGTQLVVNEYSPKGKCVLPSTSVGTLTVQTVNLSADKVSRVAEIPFKVAIRDKETQTLVMYAKEDFKQVDIRQVLAKCKKGDSIVLLSVDNQYALPHNEIIIQ
ncbi:hypothetical protein [Telluribacter humicola]|uniref:hypothetical protein n=1 Tax=Telluribacter humicola TaxID=1720261 RepID=UPI001A959E1F|nr:hypothetical protein [Telluribacter humicola]